MEVVTVTATVEHVLFYLYYILKQKTLFEKVRALRDKAASHVQSIE